VPTIDFIYFDAGGGHRAAATALKAVIEQQNRPWTVRLVNLQEVLDPLDVFRKVTSIRLEDLYNLILKKGWTLGSAQMLKFVHAVIRLQHRPAFNLLKRHWSETKPDLVVSLVPNFNRVLWESLIAADPRIPYVTILTDFADYPPHFWIERQPQLFITGTDRAYQQARELGHPPDRIFKASGMIIRPSFYQSIEVDRDAERAKLGLDPKLPTGIVLFGGQGSKVMLDIADRLGGMSSELQLIMICGRNEKLADRLRNRASSALKIHVEGFTTEIPYFMRLSDFLIGKPGPGSISEAVAMKLPVIIERNIWTLPQERFNADWVIEKGAGIVLPNFTHIASGVRQLLAPGALDSYRANVASIENRAIFEIPEILDQILKRS
jgi:1,2-diacylglycerol 3-beta-galactosyltransferase